MTDFHARVFTILYYTQCDLFENSKDQRKVLAKIISYHNFYYTLSKRVHFWNKIKTEISYEIPANFCHDLIFQVINMVDHFHLSNFFSILRGSISVGNFNRAVDRVLRPDDSSPSRGILDEIGDDEGVNSRLVTPLCLGISSISWPIQVQPMNYGHPNEWFY